MSTTHHDHVVVPVSRVDRVYYDLREAIIDGDFPPGAPLRLQELTDEYGVSLIPIREALRRLEVERLIESIPNKGARVAEISVEDVEDAYETRMALEVEALRRAWPNLDAALVADLRGTRDDLIAAYAEGDASRQVLTHRDLHFSIYERSNSPWLNHLIVMLWSHTERYRRLAIRILGAKLRSSDFHGQVLDAIEAGDQEAAIRWLREDLSRTATVVIEQHRAQARGSD